MCKIEQVSGVVEVPPEHWYHLSYSQSVQPTSPLATSHSRYPIFLSSPQISLQVSFFVRDPPLQINPSSCKQLLEQPSPFIVFPSSHSTFVVLTPSPHFSEQTDLCSTESYGQEYPSSTVQRELHPSPEIVLPSSQLLGPLSGMPSPHTLSQMSAELEEPPMQE